MKPPAACATMSYEGRSAHGPVCPKPDMLATMRRGCSRTSCSGARPQRAGVPQVERDALLVAVEREEGDRHAVRGRVAVAALVAAARRLDLDHLGTQVGEDRGAERPRQEAGQVEDADAGERAHR